MKTKNWLTEKLADGQTLSGEVLAELLDSYWHKSETGQVDEGEECPVSGKEVSLAMAAMAERLEAEMRQAIAEALPELLHEALANYVTEAMLDTKLEGVATEAWVHEQLSDKVTQQAVADSLAEKADITSVYTKTQADELLQDKAALADLPDMTTVAMKSELPDMTTVALKSELPDISGLATKTELNDYQTATNTALLAKASQADVSTAVGGLPDNASISTLRTKVNDLVTRVNTLSHVACGSETMAYCPPDMTTLQEPTP